MLSTIILGFDSKNKAYLSFIILLILGLKKTNEINEQNGKFSSKNYFKNYWVKNCNKKVFLKIDRKPLIY